MEKRKPHYSLTEIKELLSEEPTRFITRTAKLNAVKLGYMDVEDMLGVVLKLTKNHFYKSMTSHQCSRIWQDVYRIKDEEKEISLYIKLQVVGGKAIIVQFKEE